MYDNAFEKDLKKNRAFWGEMFKRVHCKRIHDPWYNNNKREREMKRYGKQAQSKTFIKRREMGKKPNWIEAP